jgi:hypothetical protein
LPRAERRALKPAGAVDRHLLAVLVLLLLHEILLARVVVALGDLLVHPVERLLLPLVRAGRAVHGLGRPQRVVGELDGGRALRAEAAEGMRRVGMPLDVDDLVALRVHELDAADRAFREVAAAWTGLRSRTAVPTATPALVDPAYLRKSRRDRLMATPRCV